MNRTAYVTPFPLCWPRGWARTESGARRHPPFRVGLTAARDSLIAEIRQLGGFEVVMSSNLPTRRDGLPYGIGRQVADPGVAVYWFERRDGQPLEREMACDRWLSPEGNMRALALSIGALRGLARWGSASIVDRAFAGFAALPANPVADWRIELQTTGLTLELARAAYREKARELHPDRGGDPEAMVRLNQAWEAAQRELGA